MKNALYTPVVGSLMYVMVCASRDIAHVIGVVSQFFANPNKKHWQAAKWILWYLKGTSMEDLCFGSGPSVLVAYTDSDMAGDIDSRKSILGYLVVFAGGIVSWQSKLQKCVALSTRETEYIAITETCKEMLWMKRLFKEWM